ncbi:MAG: hypothetical protein SFY32_08060 [Bacteroidota bacterium]|nr:hypothetical protein [Bacteroidota bacterium]
MVTPDSSPSGSLFDKDTLESLKRIKKPKFKQSGHYIDQKLKHTYDIDVKQHVPISDRINPELKKKLPDKIMVEGIRISQAEDKLMNAVLKILNDKSSGDFHGNMPAIKSLYGNESRDFPVVRFTPGELYREYAGGDYSGREIEIVKETLERLQSRNFLIVYERHREVKMGMRNEMLIDRVEEYQPLIKVITFFEGLTKEEHEKVSKGDKNMRDKKAEIIIKLNPIFVDQIDSKFIEYPTDINRITSIAAQGASKVTESIIALRDYLLRSISANKNKGINITSINADKLPYILGLEKYIKEGRRSLINLRIKQALDASLNMGLIHKFEYSIGAENQKKVDFYLNLEF